MKGPNDLPPEGASGTGVPETASPSLMEGMKRGDSASFQRFERLFGGWLLRKTRAKGVSFQDDEDIVQEVLISVSRGICAFERQRTGGFRRWVLTIHGRRVADYYREKKRRVDLVDGVGNTDISEAPPDSVDDDEHWPGDERASITDEAWKMIVEEIFRGEFEEKTFEAGRLVFLEGMSPAEVIHQLRQMNPVWVMKPSEVYVVKTRFKARLRKALGEVDIETRLRGILADFGIEPPSGFLDNMRRVLGGPGAQQGYEPPGAPDHRRHEPG